MAADGEEAGVQLAVGGEAGARAVAAERLRDGGDDADLAGAIFVYIAPRHLSPIRRLARGFSGISRADPLDDLRRRDNVVQPPAVCRADVHVLDEAHDVVRAAEAPRDVEDAVIVDAALDDDVDLDRREPRLERRLDAVEHDATPGNSTSFIAPEGRVVERVQADRHAVQAGGA